MFEINICSLAKKNEEVFIPGKKEPLETQKDQLALLLLRRIRDEAHRFAINFHRDKRATNMKRSHLVEIPGVGSIRIRALLAHFRSIQAIQLASIEEICKVSTRLAINRSYLKTNSLTIQPWIDRVGAVIDD